MLQPAATRYQLYSERLDGLRQLFRRDLTSGEVLPVSSDPTGTPGDGNSFAAVMSDDGRYVAFESDAANLVEGDDNAARDVFRKDLETGEVTRVGPLGRSARISGDGRTVAYSAGGGKAVVWSGAQAQSYTHDELRTFASDLSSDGSWLILGQEGTFERRLLLKERSSGLQEVVEKASGGRLSADDRHLAYSYRGGHKDEHAMVLDRVWERHERLSVSSSGEAANGSCHLRDLSPCGRYATFGAYANNLDSNDTDTNLDHYLHDRLTGNTEVRENSAIDADQLWPEEGGYLTYLRETLETLSEPVAGYCQSRAEAWGPFDWTAARDLKRLGKSLEDPERFARYRSLSEGLVPGEIFPAVEFLGSKEDPELFLRVRENARDFRGAKLLYRLCKNHPELLANPPELEPGQVLYADNPWLSQVLRIHVPPPEKLTLKEARSAFKTLRAVGRTELEPSDRQLARVTQLYNRIGPEQAPSVLFDHLGGARDFEQRLDWLEGRHRVAHDPELEFGEGYLRVGEVELPRDP